MSGRLTPLRSESRLPTSMTVTARSGRALDRAKAHLAVVEQQAVAGFERGEDLRVREIDAGDVAGGRVGVQHEELAGGERDLMVGEDADAQLRALQVGEDGDRPPAFELDLADDLDERAQPIVIGVAHVDAEDVGAGLEQALDRVPGGRCRTEGGEYLDLA